MLLPDKMTKILIVGSKSCFKETIDILYELEAVHPIDFSAEEEGFSLGAPLPGASEVSQKLLKLRSMEKDLEVVEKPAGEQMQVARIESEFDEAIIGLEAEIIGAVESKSSIQNRMSELQNSKKMLEPFLQLTLDIDLYSGYSNIDVFIGIVRNDPSEFLRAALDHYEVYKSTDGKFVAVFVALAEAAEAQRVLVQQGFAEIPVPVGKGNPQENMKAFDTELEALQKSLADATVKISKLRERHEDFILASDEHLSIQVEKAEFPLRSGMTAHSFVLDAWVPQKALPEVQKAFHDAMAEDVHIEVLETAPRKEHIHPEEAHTGVGEGHVVQTPPTKTSTKGPVGLFSFLTELISTPKYGEIDPTIIIAIIFPLFFGLMIGDIGYGIPFIILGALGLKKCKTKEWRTIATMLFFGGLWATILGFFVFGEAYGMHFGTKGIIDAQHPFGTELTWASMLQMDLPHLGFLSKLHDVKLILYVTLWIAVMHLALGFIIGTYNETIRHGFKHAFFHKVGWLMILIGGAFLLLFVVDALNLNGMNNPVSMTDLRFLMGMGLIIPGVAVSLMGEGGLAILELPTLLSNVMSYTRIAAIGMSKAGMALAFNMIAIEMIAPAGGIMIVAAIAIFIVGHLMIFLLAVISAGIHGIRLHYVEQFQKFYTGGGLKFNPLKIVRKHTTER